MYTNKLYAVKSPQSLMGVISSDKLLKLVQNRYGEQLIFKAFSTLQYFEAITWICSDYDETLTE